MKIAWFSPLLPQRSGIADYTGNLMRHLRHRAEVDLWVDTPTPETLPRLRMYDAIVYNMGNHLALHRGMVEVMRGFPGVVILHDYILANFYADYWLGEQKNWDHYRAQFVGDDAEAMVEFFNDYLRDPSGCAMEKLLRYPMNEEIVKSARGVVVHSEFARDLLQRAGCRKVVHLNQPAYPFPRRAIPRSRKDLGLPSDKCLLITLGPLDLTRRIEKVFEALSRAKELREQVHYVLVGEVDSRLDIAALARTYDLESLVTVTGYLTTEEMYDYIDVSDLGIALRNPTMGESSAGLVRLLERGKSCITTEVGWYAELPDECVAKVNPEREAGELLSAISRLAFDAEAREWMGRRGKHLVDTHFTAPGFVDGMLRFIESLPAPGVQPGRVLSDILQTVSETVAPLGIDSALDRVSKELGWTKG